MVGADVTVAQIQQMLDTSLPAGCVSFIVHSLHGATISHPLLAHLLVYDEVHIFYELTYLFGDISCTDARNIVSVVKVRAKAP